MIKYILTFMFFLACNAFADITVAELDKLIASDLKAATVQTEALVKSHPDSPLAHCYMDKVNKLNGITKETSSSMICDNYDKRVADHEFGKGVSTFFAWLMGIAFLCLGGYFMYYWYIEMKLKKQLEELEAEKEEFRKKLLKEVMLSKGDLENAITLCDTLNKGDSFEGELKRLLALSVDAIEILQENGDWDADEILNYLSDVHVILEEMGE